MLKKLSFASGLRPSTSSSTSFTKEKTKVVRYTPYSAKGAQASDDEDDELDEVAVISNATPANVTYDCRDSVLVAGSSTNGPPRVPGIPSSTGFQPHVPPSSSTLAPK